ncbi:PREDICTED: uncharacterized protein LOC109149135 [Ipomoea nil]|uniref:uncharacterized protein LOC109149135 n=1 Tax=Ipomoea nil TaxID=35883 RepID=UPI000900AC76|nr:PREDICTED: uncharacterized protein LOC109149135 [Ipomoea nil]XP_019152331.1 PREDICTED: uncharacterized protein LOC109149135 [Ipomoea nil]
MEWLVELMSTIIFVVLVKPFSVIKQSVSFGVRSLCIALLTWMELLRNAICLNVSILWKLTTWIIAIPFLPMRVLNALQNEKLLKMHLEEMQRELENLVWDKKGVEKQLRVAIKEHKLMGLMLRELEDEHNEAIIKIEQLEDELQGLKEENQQLKEARGKARWSPEQVDTSNLHNQTTNYTKESAATLSRRPNRAKTAKTYQEISRANAWEDENKPTIAAKDTKQPLKPADLDTTYYLQSQRRETALSRSVFSAVLSVVVGTTVWSAAEPCVPLVAALFTVVAISLRSVVQFFSSINNHPASEAVALLSFNWFILGTLTYPTLPKVARMLSPLAHNFSGTTMSFLFGLFA